MCALSLHQAMITAPRTLPHPPLRGMLEPTSTPLAVLRATDSAERLSYPGRWSRFVTITDAEPTVNWDPVERARYLAGLKDDATNTPPAMTGQQVVAAHHALYQAKINL